MRQKSKIYSNFPLRITLFSKKLDIIFAKTILEIANSRGKPSRVISFQGNQPVYLKYLKYDTFDSPIIQYYTPNFARALSRSSSQSIPILSLCTSSMRIFSPFDRARSCSSFSVFSRVDGANEQNLFKFAAL